MNTNTFEKMEQAVNNAFDLEHKRAMEEIERAKKWFDDILVQNRANGWTGPCHQTRRASDGFEIVEHTPMNSGSPEWRRVFFSRDEFAIKNWYRSHRVEPTEPEKVVVEFGIYTTTKVAQVIADAIEQDRGIKCQMVKVGIDGWGKVISNDAIDTTTPQCEAAKKFAAKWMVSHGPKSKPTLNL